MSELVIHGVRLYGFEQPTFCGQARRLVDNDVTTLAERVTCRDCLAAIAVEEAMTPTATPLTTIEQLSARLVLNKVDVRIAQAGDKWEVILDAEGFDGVTARRPNLEDALEAAFETLNNWRSRASRGPAA